MTKRMRRSWSHVPAVLVTTVLIFVPGCGDDDGEPEQGQGGQGVETSGGAGRMSAGEGGSPWFETDLEPTPPTRGCNRLAEYEGDLCLTCLRQHCCNDLVACGGTGNVDTDAGVAVSYVCYNNYFLCVRDCFEREADSALSMSSQDIAVACGSECEASAHGVLDGLSDLLSCAVSDSPEVDAGLEQDAGTDTNCANVCFSSW